MRTVRVTGACLEGTAAELVTVEARFERRERERTEVAITGLPDPVIRESRGRVVSALAASGFRLPPGRLLLNLVPAARRKSGEILDLPLCLGAAAAVGHVQAGRLAGTLFLGGVGIDGRLHGAAGGFAAARAARAAGIGRVVAPQASAREAACLPEVRAFAARDLRAVIAHLYEARPIAPAKPPEPAPDPSRPERLDEVRGQAHAKRALAVAAAGGHALLLVGPPGAGKSLLACRLPDLLPPPDLASRLEITEVASAVGRWPGGLASRRPFRAPHHTTSYAGLVGGGNPPQPGELTLAHGGVLFLDELPEFQRATLEALRQPLETRAVRLARAGRQTEMPAAFQLVCAMNACPCGMRGHPRLACRCPPGAVRRYWRRISGPLLDRIDLVVEVAPVEPTDLLASNRAVPRGSGGVELRELVLRARAAARERQGPRSNAELRGSELDRHVPLAAPSRELLARAAEARGLSARAIQSVRRVARTVADLEGRRHVRPAHVAEALALRAEPG